MKKKDEKPKAKENGKSFDQPDGVGLHLIKIKQQF